MNLSQKLCRLSGAAALIAVLILGYGFGFNRPSAAELQLRNQVNQADSDFLDAGKNSDKIMAGVLQEQALNRSLAARDAQHLAQLVRQNHYQSWQHIGWLGLTLAGLLLIGAWLASPADNRGVGHMRAR